MSYGDDEYVDVPFDFILVDNPTKAAVLFELVEGEDPVWIPRSVLGDVDPRGKTAEVKTWWAEKEGLV